MLNQILLDEVKHIGGSVTSSVSFSFPTYDVFSLPKGVLRIHFIEAEDLLSKDTYMKGLIKGKSDPYGIIQVGNQLFKSKVIRENLNPKWREVHEVSAAVEEQL